MDQLVDALAPLGVHLPADRLIAFLLRYPEHFRQLADGRLDLAEPGLPIAPSAKPGFRATDEPEPDPELGPEPERPWWTDQPDLSTTWDDVFVLPTPRAGRRPALVWHVGGQRWLRPHTPGVPVPIPHPAPCLLTWAPRPDKELAAAVELPFGATESFRAFDVATLALLVDPTAPAADLDELCHHLGLPPTEPAEPGTDRNGNPGTAHDPAVDEVHALMRVIGALAQRAPGGPTWQLALRLLAEDGSPWPALVGAARPPDDLAAAIRTRPDPLCRRAPGTDLGPHARLRTANGLPAAFRGLADARADYQQRPAQHEMARIVAEALDAGHPAAIEAPTGTGKSIGYLLPAAVRTATHPREAIVVATHTKVLQRQLRHTAEELRAAGLLPAPFRQLYGVTNYLCPREVVDTIRSGEPPAGSWRPVAVALRALETAPAGVWDDIGDDAVRRAEGYAAGKAALRTTAADCERRRCAWVHQCPLYRRLDEVDRDPGIIATNHALVAAAVSPYAAPAARLGAGQRAHRAPPRRGSHPRGLAVHRLGPADIKPGTARDAALTRQRAGRATARPSVCARPVHRRTHHRTAYPAAWCRSRPRRLRPRRRRVPGRTRPRRGAGRRRPATRRRHPPRGLPATR
ncbi:MAG: hypothetical protein R2755_23630 [Acidimicrobiales bacterium]